MSDLGAGDNSLVLHGSLRGELTQEIAEVRREVERTGREARQLDQAGRTGSRGVDQVGRSARTSARSVGELHRGLLGMSRDLGQTVSHGLRVGATAFGVLTGAVTAFGLKSASNLETGRIQLETLVGSASEADRVFRHLIALDPKVPFDIGQLQQTTVALANVNLQGAGLERMLQGVSDVAAATVDPSGALPRVTRAVAQMHSANTILAEELNQLVDAGVAVGPALEQAYGISLAEFRRRQQSGDQKLNPDRFFEVLFGMRQGVAERVATETLSGLLSGVRSRITLKLADSASPLVQSLKTNLPSIEAAIGGVLDTVGPPFFGLLGQVADAGTRLLPIIGPPLESLANGVGLLLSAAAPGLKELGPLGELFAGSINELVRELLPSMPELVELALALVRVLPDAIGLVGDLVRMTMPLARLATTLLGYDGVREVLAGLLVVLLGYRALSSIITTLNSFAGGLGNIATQTRAVGAAQTAAGIGGPAGAAGANRTAGAINAIVGTTSAGLMIADRVQHGGRQRSLGEDVGLIGSTALAGAGIGSIVPVLGTGFGAGLGAAAGLGISVADRFLGDPPMAASAAAGHSMANAAAGGGAGRRVTSGYRSFALRGPDSGHLNGTAVDVAGSGLAGYVSAARSLGARARIHGNHAHAEYGDPPMPRGTTSSTPAGGLGIRDIIFTGPINGIADLRAAVRQILAQIERERTERAYRPPRSRNPWQS